MELLKERIRKDGVMKPGNVLKVDSFLNHQMDVKLLMKWEKSLSADLRESGLTKF